MKVDGKCLCGFLKYEAEVDADSTFICHCRDRQTLAGSAFRTGVAVVDGFRFLAGTPKHYVKVADGGNKRVLGSCLECGTSVYSKPEEGKARLSGLCVGSLTQRDVLTPRTHSGALRLGPGPGKLPAYRKSTAIDGKGRPQGRQLRRSSGLS